LLPSETIRVVGGGPVALSNGLIGWADKASMVDIASDVDVARHMGGCLCCSSESVRVDIATDVDLASPP